jgi:hypothetical protein
VKATSKQIREALIKQVCIKFHNVGSKVHDLSNDSLVNLVGLEVAKNIITKLDNQ